MVGRKPKLTAVKKLEGNPGKKKLNTKEPVPAKGMPDCPDWLMPEAKAEWNRLAKGLSDMGVLAEEMKNYLRVDFEDDDALLAGLIVQAQQICLDISRLEEADFEATAVAKIAVMYAVAYLYEHREDADHKELTLGLRALLFGIRMLGF